MSEFEAAAHQQRLQAAGEAARFHRARGGEPCAADGEL